MTGAIEQVASRDDELRATARTLRQIRLWAAGFLGLQFWLYAAPDGGLPWPRWPVAIGLLVVLMGINWLSSLLSSSESVTALERAAVLEVLLDATVAVGVTLLFAFDESSRLWPLLMFPVLEGALRLGRRGALTVWAYSALSYAIDQGLRLSSREDPASWIAGITFAVGVMLLVAIVAGSMAAKLLEATEAAQEQARQLRVAGEGIHEAKEAAEAANAAKSDFLSRMSHELRTPLNAVLGFGQLLQFEEMSPESRDGVGHILDAGQHLLGLIEQVLEIARIEAGEATVVLESLLVGEVVGEVADLLGPAADRRAVTIIRAPEGWSTVLADRQHLKQILLNIIGNAIKYNVDGGRVEISEEVSDEGVRVLVRDTGRGIATEDLSRVFVPFDRLGAETENIEGTGLGLALSLRLAQEMGGDLTVDSESGVGSTFALRLLKSTETVAPRSEAVAAAPDKQDALRGRVLYIEDNLSNLRLVERLINRLVNVELLSAMQGSIGLEMGRTHRPDLILLDLNLPDLDGGQVLAELRADESTKHIPVIIVSADATPTERRRLLSLGAHAYLTKPLDVPFFLETVARFLPESDAAAIAVSEQP